MQRQPVFAYQFEGRRYDTGRPLGLLTASIEIAHAPRGHRARAAGVPAHTALDD